MKFGLLEALHWHIMSKRFCLTLEHTEQWATAIDDLRRHTGTADGVKYYLDGPAIAPTHFIQKRQEVRKKMAERVRFS